MAGLNPLELTAPTETKPGVPGVSKKPSAPKRDNRLLVEQIQQFLIDRGLSAGSVDNLRVPDGKFGVNTNNALIAFITQPAFQKESDAAIVEALRPLIGSHITRDPKDTVESLDLIYQIIRAGGEPKHKGRPQETREIQFTYHGTKGTQPVDVVFPIATAVSSLANLDQDIKDHVIAPYYEANGRPVPGSYEAYDPTEMLHAVQTLRRTVVAALRALPNYADSQRLQNATDYVDRLFAALASRYSAKSGVEKEQSDALTALRKDFAAHFQQARNPQLRALMETRALRILENHRAANAAGKIISQQLYNYALGFVRRELENLLSYYQRNPGLFTPAPKAQPTQAPVPAPAPVAGPEVEQSV